MTIARLTEAIAALISWGIWLSGVLVLLLGCALAARVVWSGYREGAQRIDARASHEPVKAPRVDDPGR